MYTKNVMNTPPTTEIRSKIDGLTMPAITVVTKMNT